MINMGDKKENGILVIFIRCGGVAKMGIAFECDDPGSKLKLDTQAFVFVTIHTAFPRLFDQGMPRRHRPLGIAKIDRLQICLGRQEPVAVSIGQRTVVDTGIGALRHATV